MKTRIVALLMVLVLLVPVVSFAEEMMWVKTPNQKSVNMRAESRKDAAILIQIPYGAAVTKHHDMLGSDFAYCTYKGHKGYIDRQYLVNYEPQPTPKPQPQPEIDNSIYKGFKSKLYLATVTPSKGTHTVNLRWAPSKAAPIHNVLEGGTTLLVVAANKTWAQVYDLNTHQSGFMMNEFLTYASEYDPHAVGTQAN